MQQAGKSKVLQSLLWVLGGEEFVGPRVADANHDAAEDRVEPLALVLPALSVVDRYVDWRVVLVEGEGIPHQRRARLGRAGHFANAHLQRLESLRDSGLVVAVREQLARRLLHSWVEILDAEPSNWGNTGRRWCRTPLHPVHVLWSASEDPGRRCVPQLHPVLSPARIRQLHVVAFEDRRVDVERTSLAVVCASTSKDSSSSVPGLRITRTISVPNAPRMWLRKGLLLGFVTGRPPRLWGRGMTLILPQLTDTAGSHR